MQWFRQKDRGLVQLALFALLLQICVSFGHIHADDLGLASPLSHDTAVNRSGSLVASVPADDDHPSVPADYCQICASMALAGSLILSAPPLLMLPVVVDIGRPANGATGPFLNHVRFSFRARAPPFA